MKHVDDRPPSAPRVHGAAQTPLARQESVAAPKITRRSTNAWRAGRRRIDYQPTAGALAALEAYLTLAVKRIERELGRTIDGTLLPHLLERLARAALDTPSRLQPKPEGSIDELLPALLAELAGRP